MITRYCYELDRYHTGTPPECVRCGLCSRFIKPEKPAEKEKKSCSTYSHD